MIRHQGLLLLSLLLVSCGFHLRGLGEVPAWMQRVFIVNENVNREIPLKLKMTLESYQVIVTDNPKEALYWIVLEKDDVNQSLISVAASNGPRQFQLTYTLAFHCQTTKTNISLPSERVTINRIFTQNSNTLLGSNYEQQQFITELHQAAIMQLLNHINSTHCQLANTRIQQSN